MPQALSAPCAAVPLELQWLMPVLLLLLNVGFAFSLPTVQGVPRDRSRSAKLHGRLKLSPGQSTRFAFAEGMGAGRMKRLYPWYHTSAEIHNEAQNLVANCGGAASIKTVEDSGVSIDLVQVKAPNTSPVNRVFVMFGEHPRELIAPESGLHLLRILCGESSDIQNVEYASEVLQDSEFGLVLNGNPRSRRIVESGLFCVRTNPQGVDLNRNWDEKWTVNASAFKNANPGPHPFSEPETRMFRRLVTEYRPTTFLTVHSGTRGLYMPWAYDTVHLANRNQPQMLQILKDIDENHCQCPYGAAGKEVGYACPGTCLDWVYDQLQTPYSFAFEIYVSRDHDEKLHQRWDTKVAQGGNTLLQNGAHLGHPHFLSLFQEHASDFVHTVTQQHAADFLNTATGVDADNEELLRNHSHCFALFNPDSQMEYVATVRNWATAYLDLARKVVEDMRIAQTDGRADIVEPATGSKI